MRNTSNYSPWDVLLAKVFYDDKPEEYKIRPVVLIDKKANLYLMLKMTSHKPRSNFPGEYPVQHWREAGLKKPSTIRASQINRTPLNLIYKKIGTLHQEDQKNLYFILQKIYLRN